MMLIAHRGGRYDGVPGEQTLVHFERALSLGADFIEVDLRRTRDGVVICMHDADYAGVLVQEVSFAELVVAAKHAGLPAPARLVELLELCRGRCRVDLEFKVAGIEAGVLDAVRRHLGLDDAIFKAFDDAVVASLKRQEPSCFAGLLLGREHARFGGLSRLGELFPLARLVACGADFVSPNHRLVRAGFMERMHLAGYPVYVWTVNDMDVARRLIERGVDGLITDEVEAFAELWGVHR